MTTTREIIPIPQVPLLTEEQEIALGRIVQGDDPVAAKRARNDLIDANMRLVISIARKYQGHQVPLKDLVQEGSLGLLRAAEKFDPEKGYRFPTYARWWIEQSVQRALPNQGTTIRVPIHAYEQLRKIIRTNNDYMAEHGREATKQELAEITELDEEEVERLMMFRSAPTSLNRTMQREEGSEQLGNILPDLETETPEEESLRSDLRRCLREALASLDQREQFIIMCRYNLVDEHEWTLEDIGKELGITRERVRQLVKSALTKMKKHSSLIGLES